MRICQPLRSSADGSSGIATLHLGPPPRALVAGGPHAYRRSIVRIRSATRDITTGVDRGRVRRAGACPRLHRSGGPGLVWLPSGLLHGVWMDKHIK